MMTLSPILSPRVLLSFDFDGTLHDPSEEPPISLAFFERIVELRETRGAVWGINTGRTMNFLLEGLADAQVPIGPDWIVVRERDIYIADGAGGWESHRAWNEMCEGAVAELFGSAETLLRRIRHDIESHTGATWIEMDGEPPSLVTRTEEEMEWIVGRIGPMVSQHPNLAWQRNSIYLRFGHRDFQKGSALAEVGRVYGVEVEQRLAMGDSNNDVEMLDLKCAGMIACPSNSIELIRRTVEGVGGYVAKGAHSAGVLEALGHYFP